MSQKCNTAVRTRDQLLKHGSHVSSICKICPVKAETFHVDIYTYIHYRKTFPKTGHKGPVGEYRYNSTLSLTSVLDGRWVVDATP